MVTRVQRVEGDGLKGATFSLDTRKTVVLVGRNGEGKSGRLYAMPTALQKPPPRRGGRGGVHPWLGDEPADVGGTASSTLIVDTDAGPVEVQRKVGKKHEVTASVNGTGASGADAETIIAERFDDADGLPVDLAGFAGLTPEKQREQLEAAAGAGASSFDHVSLVAELLEGASAEWKDDAGEKQKKPVHHELATELLGKARAAAAPEFITAARAWLGTGKGGLFSEWNGRLTDARGARERLPVLGEEDIPAGRPAQLQHEIDRNEEARTQAREQLAVARAQVDNFGVAERAAFATAEQQLVGARDTLTEIEGTLRQREPELQEVEGRIAAHRAEQAQRESALLDVQRRRREQEEREAGVKPRLDGERRAAQQARDALSGAQAQVDHLRKSIAALEQHGTCPVCGVTGDTLGAAVEALRAQLAEVDGQLWDLEETASEAAATAKASEMELQEIRGVLQKIQPEAGRRTAELEATTKNLRAEEQRAEKLRPVLEQARRRVEEQRQRAVALERRVDELYAAIPTGDAPDNSVLIARLETRIGELDGIVARDKADLKRIEERETLEGAYAQNNQEIDRCLHKRASVQELRRIVDEVSAKLIEQTFGPVSSAANELVDAAYGGQQRFAFRPADIGESGWGYGLREDKPRRPGKAPRGWRPYRALSDSEGMVCGLGLRFAELTLRDAGFRPFPLDRLEAVNDDVAGRLVAFLAKQQAAGKVSNALFAWRGTLADWNARVAPHLGDAAALVEVVDCDAL